MGVRTNSKTPNQTQTFPPFKTITVPNIDTKTRTISNKRRQEEIQKQNSDLTPNFDRYLLSNLQLRHANDAKSRTEHTENDRTLSLLKAETDNRSMRSENTHEGDSKHYGTCLENVRAI